MLIIGSVQTHTMNNREHYTDNQQIEELLPPEEYTVISGKTDEELAQLLGVEVADLLAIL